VVAGVLSADNWKNGGNLGFVCATAFLAEGAHVVLVDGAQTTLDGLAARLAAPDRVHTICVDLLDPAALARAAETCAKKHRAVHGLVNCHFDLEDNTNFADSDDATWNRVLEFNLLGPVRATKAFLPLLTAAGEAAVVHVGSIDGQQGNPQFPAYSVAKGGLVPLTHVMANDLAARGIRVNCVARGMWIERGQTPSPNVRPVIDQTPLGRPAYPDEIAAVILSLISPSFSYVTGAVLTVDGGRTGITPGTRRIGT